MKSISFKPFLPTIVALLVSIVLSLVYFSPVLEGKRLKQGDKTRWQGMAQEIQEHRAEFGEEPLWSGSMFSGMPAYQMSVNWDSNLLKTVHKVLTLGLPTPASFFFLYLMGMFFLLRVLKIDPWLSIVGAIAFAMSSYFFIIIEAGHNSKALAIAYMAPTLASFIILYRGKLLLGAVLLSFFMGMELTMNHPQVTYYLGFVLLFFALAEAIRCAMGGELSGFIKRSGLGLTAVLLAVLCNFGSLWATYEYGQYTTRGKSELTKDVNGVDATKNKTDGLDRDYVTDWSYGIAESLSLLIPNAKGGATANFLADRENLNMIKDPRVKQMVQQQGMLNSYWGDQTFTSGPVYIGALVVLLLFLSIGRMGKLEMYWAIAALPLTIVLVQLDASMVAGVLVLGYIIAGMFMKPDPLRYALWSGLYLTLLLSWGKNYMPLTDFFLDVIPGYNKFRAVTIILVIVELAAPILGILYLNEILKEERKWNKDELLRFYIPVGTLTLFLLVNYAAPETFNDFLSVAERQQFNNQIDANAQQGGIITEYANGIKQIRMDVFKADTLRSLLFVLIGAAILFLFGKGMIKSKFVIAGFALLMLFDLWSVDKRYLNNEKERSQYVQWESIEDAVVPHAPTKADMSILRRESNDAIKAFAESSIASLKESKKGGQSGKARVTEKEQQLAWFGALRRNKHLRVLDIGNPWNDARTSYFHKSIGGYHGAKLKRYNELIEFHLSPEVAAVKAGLQSGGSFQSVSDVFAGNGVMNMLNTKYVSYNPEAEALVNLNANGPAWFVNKVDYVGNADDEITGLRSLNTKTEAIAVKKFEGVLGAASTDASANITLDEYRTNSLKYTSNSSKDGVAVFSEIWYGPDWQAYIDGKPVDHGRVNYVLRALRVPAGQHTIEFKVESKAYSTGSLVNTGASAIVILLVLGALFMEFKRGSEE